MKTSVKNVQYLHLTWVLPFATIRTSFKHCLLELADAMIDIQGKPHRHCVIEKYILEWYIEEYWKDPAYKFTSWQMDTTNYISYRNSVTRR